MTGADTHEGGTSPTISLLAVAVLASVLSISLEASPASAASPDTCRVRNATTGKSYTVLQAAVDAARWGERLTVRGTCHGGTVIDKSLVIEGAQDQESAEAILHGHHRGVVVTVRKGVTATITDVSIIGGRGQFRPGGPEKPYNWPAGVVNRGHLTLAGVVVKGNHGIGVENAGSLRLSGDTVIGNNGYWAGNNTYSANLDNRGSARLKGTATVRGYGGVDNEGGVLVLSGAARVTNSRVANSGTLTLNDGSQFGDTDVQNEGSLTLNDSSRIIGFVRGGEVYGDGVRNTGSLTLNDSSVIRDHHVGVANSGTLTLNDDSRISHNGEFIDTYGAGVDNSGTLTLNGTSQINDNWLGVENRGSVVLNGSSSIRDNHRMQYRSRCPNFCGSPPRLVGAGVSNKGSLTLNDASSISGNTAADSGAGVYLWEGAGASLTMTGSSRISGNTTGKSAGGVYAGAGSTLSGAMCGSQTAANVVGNTPDDCHIDP